MTLADDWRRVARDLNLQIVAPFRVHLPGDAILDIDVLLPDFGDTKGILLIDDYSKIRDYASTLVEMGYGFSTLSPHQPDSPYELDVYKELLSDWGWSGSPESKPDWIVEVQEEEDE